MSLDNKVVSAAMSLIVLVTGVLCYKDGKHNADHFWQAREAEFNRNGVASIKSLMKSEEQIEERVKASVPVCITPPKPIRRVVIECPPPDWLLAGDKCVSKARPDYVFGKSFIPCFVDGYATWCDKDNTEPPICPSGHFCTEIDGQTVVTR